MPLQWNNKKLSWSEYQFGIKFTSNRNSVGWLLDIYGHGECGGDWKRQRGGSNARICHKFKQWYQSIGIICMALCDCVCSAVYLFEKKKEITGEPPM